MGMLDSVEPETDYFTQEYEFPDSSTTDLPMYPPGGIRVVESEQPLPSTDEVIMSEE